MPINRLNDENKGIAIIRDSTTDEDTDISYCPSCSEFRHTLHRLGPLILLPDEQLPPDFDNFKQCGYCYTVVPIYEVRTEGTLFTDIESIKNPFDFGKTVMQGIHERGLKNRIKQIKKKTRKGKEEYSKDIEVMNEVKQGAVITAYYTDAND
jgi:hypothetical protein